MSDRFGDSGEEDIRGKPPEEPGNLDGHCSPLPKLVLHLLTPLHLLTSLLNDKLLR